MALPFAGRSEAAMLEVTDLVATRSATFCLQLPALRARGGTILCIAGPNGSGKTTLIECLAGLLQPHKGVVRIKGEPVTANLASTKARIGFIPDDEAWFVPELSAREYIRLLHKVYSEAGTRADMPARAEHMARELHFSAFDQPLASLSHGNKKKVQIIAGLLHAPSVIIVDELRNGLDPLAIIAAEQILKAEAARGATVVAATHDLWWAERIADELLLLINGKPAVHDTIARITRTHGSVEALFMARVQAGGA